MSSAGAPLNRWRQIESLFQEALRQPISVRDAWLREACAADTELHREVASLLANHHATASAGPWAAAAAQLIVPPVLLEPGQYLGPYQIVAFLAAGGMGEVYRARDIKLKRDVALKVLPEAFARDPDRMARFQREAEILASLNHPNIAAIYDLEETNGTRYLVLELVEGETLADKITRGPIRVEDSLNIAIQICEALEAAHERGVIHRDLKPANVKITPEGKVKLLDFGLAKAMESVPASPVLSNSPTMLSGTLGGVILGTAGYMSPEQAKGRPADKRSDVWAFGCVLYEMLTGKMAFKGEGVSDTLAAVLRSEPDWTALPTDLSPSVRALIEGSLKKDHRERIADISIARLLMSEPIASLQRTERARQISMWGRALPFTVTALLVAALTAGVMWLWL